jgi:GTP-binding protein
MFVDRVIIYVKGGDGGHGCLSFRREKYVPKGGPDGGDGGDGGDVIVRAVAGTDSLADVVNRKHWRADEGGRGGGDNCHGRNADDLVIAVPPGTIIRDRDRGNVLRDLVRDGEEVVVARGGRGGRGNRAFVSATNRAPRETTPGTPGEERWLVLELKVIADVGLLGLPNAGKSTLLSRLSRAQPEIADYPFTTKHPNLGLVTLGDERAFVLADLPGLIEGAHAGVGLGHEFLRHVERTRVLIHLVEPFPTDGSDPLHNYHVIRRELELHGRAVAEKPEVVAVSKAELTGSDEARQRLERELGRQVFAISAVTGKGLAELVAAVVRTLSVERNSFRSPPAQERNEFRSTTKPPDVVVDVGNTRIKFGRCSADGVEDVASLAPDDAGQWAATLDEWNLARRLVWVIAGVHPERRDRLAAWARRRGDVVHVLERAEQLPLRVALEHPDRAGIDRLLAAVAANGRRRPDAPAVAITAGTAVTVNWIDETGAFRGGAILPGLHMMARALHEHTALLPKIEMTSPDPEMPGTSTPAAMEAGIFWAVAGGVRALVERLARKHPAEPPDVFLTGGDGPLLQPALGPDVQLWPAMTLEGIRLSAAPRQ